MAIDMHIMKYKSLIFSMVAISFAPIIYILGLFYYQGKLNAFGIDSDNFPLSIQDVYINAFYFFYCKIAIALLFAMRLIKNIIDNAFIVSIFAVAMLVTTAIVISYQSEIKAFLTKTVSSIQNMRPCLIIRVLSHLFSAIGLFYRIISPLYVISYAAFVSLFLIFAIPYWAYNTGKNNAFESLARYNKIGCTPKSQQIFSDCITYKDLDKKTEISGIAVQRNSDTIAIYNGINTTIYKISDSYLIKKDVVQPKI